MSAAVDMSTSVALFDGQIDRPAAAAPLWTGTLGDFWLENEDAYFSLDAFCASLGDFGFVHLGGGAAPEFTLVVLP